MSKIKLENPDQQVPDHRIVASVDHDGQPDPYLAVTIEHQVYPGDLVRILCEWRDGVLLDERLARKSKVTAVDLPVLHDVNRDDLLALVANDIGFSRQPHEDDNPESGWWSGLSPAQKQEWQSWAWEIVMRAFPGLENEA